MEIKLAQAEKTVDGLNKSIRYLEQMIDPQK